MRADLAQKQADTRSKLDLSRYEPWKVAFGGMAAGAGLFVAVTGLLVALASLAGFRLPSASQPPQQIVIQLAPRLALVPSPPGK